MATIIVGRYVLPPTLFAGPVTSSGTAISSGAGTRGDLYWGAACPFGIVACVIPTAKVGAPAWTCTLVGLIYDADDNIVARRTLGTIAAGIDPTVGTPIFLEIAPNAKAAFDAIALDNSVPGIGTSVTVAAQIRVRLPDVMNRLNYS